VQAALLEKMFPDAHLFTLSVTIVTLPSEIISALRRLH